MKPSYEAPEDCLKRQQYLLSGAGTLRKIASPYHIRLKFSHVGIHFVRKELYFCALFLTMGNLLRGSCFILK